MRSPVEGAHPLTTEELAGQREPAAVLEPLHTPQDAVEVGRGQGTLVAFAGRELHSFSDPDAVPTERDHDVFRDVVARRVEQPARDHSRRHGHSQVAGWIELDEVPVASCVLDRESGCHPLRLGVHHHPRAACVGAHTPDRAARGLLGGHREKADAVGEPRRVGRLIQRVEIGGGRDVVTPEGGSDAAHDAPGMEDAAQRPEERRVH